jgi:hypothetical protein
MASMMESMLRDPNLQKMLYPYLPEPMRNPDSIEWMLKTPEVRKQMETMFAQSVSGADGLGCATLVEGTGKQAMAGSVTKQQHRRRFGLLRV